MVTVITIALALTIFLLFSQGKVSITLLLHIYIYLILPIFTFSLQPESGEKPFPDILCDVVAVEHSTTLAIRHPIKDIIAT